MDDLNLRYKPPSGGLARHIKNLSVQSFLNVCRYLVDDRYHNDVEVKVKSILRINPETPLTVQTDGRGNVRGVRQGIYQSRNEDLRKQLATDIVSDVIDFDMELSGELTPRELFSHLSSGFAYSSADLKEMRRKLLEQVKNMYSKCDLSMKLLLDFHDKEPLLLPVEPDRGLTIEELDYRSHLVRRI